MPSRGKHAIEGSLHAVRLETSCWRLSGARYLGMKTFGFPSASAVSFIFLLASCSPPFGESATHDLVVALPPAPAAWAFLPELRMRLSWMEPGGSLRSLLAEPGSRLEI